MQTKYKQPDLRCSNIMVHQASGTHLTPMFITKNNRQGSYSAKEQGINLLGQELKLAWTDLVGVPLHTLGETKARPVPYAMKNKVNKDLDPQKQVTI